jgi:hypothetical protein
MRWLTRWPRAKMLVLLVVALNVTTTSRADETVRAVWNVQEIYLPYFGLTTHYSCDGLRSKMRDLLKQLGVREDFVVSVGCTEISGPAYNPSVRIVVANAVPATDEVAKAFAADPKRAALLARLAKNDKTLGDNSFNNAEPFDAVLRRVTLFAKNNSSPGASGDCELLEQLNRFVLPKLGAKVLNNTARCTPYQGSVGNPSTEVELLVPVPKT